ncbi:tripartite tricarboxylate transporter substrate binding protein [Xylophilus rhododendri]|uniref:tripartite tricarboxylate transporter substrate binding protein n=1 Tax=Xylophilus rhododendri TaxID=2697032 RepID=UPI00227B5BAE|nr:tripartite tricarboxylate transporter substrate binding protein [Xylophilus rhododendri]
MANFLPVGVASKTSMVITTRKNDSRFKTVGEFIAFAKANPGRINCGHAGPGTPNHLAILQMENAAGIQLSAVAYKGSGPALVDLLGGTLDAVFDQISSSMPHFKAGNLQALAVLGPQPEALLPGVPTLAQSGLPEFDSTTYAGLLLPAGTPPAVVGTLGAALKKALADPQMNASLKELGSSVYDADAAAFSRMLVSEDQLATAMVRDGKLKSD